MLHEKNCRILIGLCELVFMNHSIMLFDGDNKTKLVPASFSYFLELLQEKILILSLKSVIVTTVMISLHYKETN